MYIDKIIILKKQWEPCILFYIFHYVEYKEKIVYYKIRRYGEDHALPEH